MTNDEKIKMLEQRKRVLEARETDNFGVCRRIDREIRKLKANKKQVL